MNERSPPREKTPELGSELMLFFRAEGFYAVQAVKGAPLRQQAADHAAINPGTLRVEDISGNLLWSLQ